MCSILCHRHTIQTCCGTIKRDSECEKEKKNKQGNTEEENFFNLIRAFLSVFIGIRYICVCVCVRTAVFPLIGYARNATTLDSYISISGIDSLRQLYSVRFNNKIKSRNQNAPKRKTQVHENFAHRKKPSFRNIDSLRVTIQFSWVQFILLHFPFGRKIEFDLTTKRQIENFMIHHCTVPINRLIKDFLHNRLTQFAFWNVASKIIYAIVFGVFIDFSRYFCLLALYLSPSLIFHLPHSFFLSLSHSLLPPHSRFVSVDIVE